MKLAISSDWHLSKNTTNQEISMFLQFLAWSSSHCDKIVLAGDIFDDSIKVIKNTSNYHNLLAQRLLELFATNIAEFVRGNHDQVQQLPTRDQTSLYIPQCQTLILHGHQFDDFPLAKAERIAYSFLKSTPIIQKWVKNRPLYRKKAKSHLKSLKGAKYIVYGHAHCQYVGDDGVINTGHGKMGDFVLFSKGKFLAKNMNNL